MHTSSAAAIGEAARHGRPRGLPAPGLFLSTYEESKYLAEREVLALGRELGVEVVSVNPSSVQGPGRTGGSARLLLDLMNGRLPIVDTFLSIVDVDDCTRGHLLAAERGRAGERYLLSGVSLHTRHAVGLLRAETGRPHRVRRVPRAAATVAGVARRGRRAPSRGATRRSAASSCAPSCTATGTTARAPCASSASRYTPIARHDRAHRRVVRGAGAARTRRGGIA